jgi:hypothetical protein
VTIDLNQEFAKLTVISCENRNDGTTETPEVWRCESCRCFHLRAGQVLMVFMPKEFEVFTNDVVECYCVQPVPADLADANC